MSFDNAWKNRKDWRKPYYKSKAFDRSCRNHGSCGYCRIGRLHKHKRAALEKLLPCFHYQTSV